MVSASGGGTSAQNGTAGNGGDGGAKGGAGGVVGAGTAGGAGGTITLTSMKGGITLNGDVRATGSAGGDVNGTAGNGGNGSLKGGAWRQRRGSRCRRRWRHDQDRAASQGTLTINGDIAIVADGGNGGNQNGFAGNGGDADPAVSGSIGGDGGNVGPAGAGGFAGTITINARKKPSIINTSAQPGLPGVQNGTPGQGGAGETPGQPGMRLTE